MAGPGFQLPNISKRTSSFLAVGFLAPGANGKMIRTEDRLETQPSSDKAHAELQSSR